MKTIFMSEEFMDQTPLLDQRIVIMDGYRTVSEEVSRLPEGQSVFRLGQYIVEKG
jgi:hypothetical protein